MAFPAVAGTPADTQGSLDLGDNLAMPSGITAGELLVMVLVLSEGGPRTPPSGWTEIFDANFNASSAQIYACAKIAAGSETATRPSGTSGSYAGTVFRVSGADTSSTVANAIAASANATGSSSAPNPANLTPSGGAQDYLWFAIFGNETSNTVLGYPTNFSGGRVVSGSLLLALSDRQQNAASQDPGTFSTLISNPWGAVTLGIRPATASAVFSPKRRGQFAHRLNR